MNNTIEQLILIPETFEERLERKMKEIINQSEKVRKSQYAKITNLTKVLQETKHKLECLEESLCRCKNNEYANLPLFSTIN